jgi:hypothetical protein
VIAAPTEAQALELVKTRNADAIVNLGTRQLQTAQAARPVRRRHERRHQRHLLPASISPARNCRDRG